MSIRNIAIIAHVDHGKTTLVDGLLWASGTFRDNQQVQERAMDNIDIERERGITLVAKNAAIQYKDHKINLVDTPGHADFGGEVERGLQMVDGCVLLVDAAEGPLPQTRFVLKHALELDRKIILLINKIDRPDARPMEVVDEVYELFLDLDARDHQIEFPILYTNARERYALYQPDESPEGKTLLPVLDEILKTLPPPQVSPGGFQLLVANTSYNDYVGRLAVGKVQAGNVAIGDKFVVCGEQGKITPAAVTALFQFEGLQNIKVDSARAGDIVIIAGSETVRIGDTLCAPDEIRPLERLEVEEPTLSIEFCVSSSPLAGRDGKPATSRMLWDRLQRELRTNVALKAEATNASDTFIVKGRGELQFAVLAEQMRREGLEFALGRPKVLTRMVNGVLEEPTEHVVMDVPEGAVGAISERLGMRRGEMTNLIKMSGSRVRLEFDIPSRGLIGYRSEFLNDTRGSGIMSTFFTGYQPSRGGIVDRVNGAIVADRDGTTTPYALFNLEDRGRLFVGPQTQVYEGMVVGEHNRANDLNVNVCREKKLTNIRAAGSDENIILTPPARVTLEKGIAWLAEDELLEVTPNHLRLRKRVLSADKRSVIRGPKE